MAVTTRYTPTWGHLSYLLIALTGAIAVLAVLPIAAAVLGRGGGTPVTRTAYADAAPGNYLVVARNEDTFDVIAVAPASDPAAATEVARVGHLPGYASSGAVSGSLLAMVVADAGTVSSPSASLVLVGLETGVVTRVAEHIDQLQGPVWAPGGEALVVTRTSPARGGLADVLLLRVGTDGSIVEAGRFEGVLGAYPVGFDASGRLVVVVIDHRGSTAYRDGEPAVVLSSEITRDWRLSHDGAALAFIETNVTGGLHYVARVAALDGGTAAAAAQAASTDGQSLGVAWRPGAAAPTFGYEPSRGASAQSVGGGGFDVPFAYSADGAALLVEHWTGTSYAAPGERQFQLLSGGDRVPAGEFSRFYGWATR